jgi:flagellar biosynthesis protein FlhF
MRIRKFVAADMKDALAQIKRDLGADAMIVATRPVRRGLLGQGVEVTAAVDIDDPAPAAPTAPRPALAPAAITDADVERILGPLRSELRTLRSYLRPAEPRADEELRAELREMRRTLGQLRAHGGDDQVPLAALAAKHELSAPSAHRIVGLVGPTGVGKTTTIAKLAARAALIERRQVAIVTLDSYRVGGVEQMRAFADLMGVPCTVVAEPERLGRVVDEQLGGYERIFVDTAGRSPRDPEAVSQLQLAFNGLDAELHLTLPAGSTAPAIDNAAARLEDIGIRRLLFTKLDEADRLDQIVRAPARLGLPVSWVTTGQRVPEDLEEATPERLLSFASMGLGGLERAA